MAHFADTLSSEQRRRARIYAYFSTYTGCISEVMLDSSAIIIVYMSMLDASNTSIMLSTSFSGIFGMLFLIPFAYITSRIGMKRSVGIACSVGCAGYLLMAAAPFFGDLRQTAVLIGCMIYCVQRSFYSVTWYPLLDAFLRPQDRGSFFGTMRYSYMLLSGAIFFIIGKLMGKNPSMVFMQSIIAATGILLLGRWYCINKFPGNTTERPVKLNIVKSLAISMRNGPLISYSVYSGLLSLTYTSLIPVTLLYLKNYVQLPPGTVQIFSTVGIAGSIVGFFFYGFLLKTFKIKRMEFFVHAAFLTVAFLLFYLNKDMPGFIWLIGGVYFLSSFTTSLFLCNNSTELMALARPGNKPMAMAFQQTYTNMGVSIGRTGTSLILGANMLAPVWNFNGLTVSNYQTMFLFYGVIAAVLLALLPTLPAVVPKHRDYYSPVK